MTDEEKLPTAQVVISIKSRQLDQPFTFLVPGELLGSLVPGTRVLVPFGHRYEEGFVLSLSDAHHEQVKLKPIICTLEDEPAWGSETLPFAQWFADRYVSTIGSTLASMYAPLNTTRTNPRFFFAGDQPEGLIQDLAAQEILAIIKNKPGITLKTLEQQFPSRQLKILLPELIARGTIVARAANTRSSAFRTGPTELQSRKVAARNTTARPSGTDVKSSSEKALSSPPDGQSFRSKMSFPGPGHCLTAEQLRARAKIVAAIKKGKPAIFLLHGITGSGKTEIYMGAAEEVLAKGEQVLFLVPEIALTAHLEKRLVAYFGPEHVHVIHSEVSGRYKSAAFRSLRQGQPVVVLGARSAAFAPFAKLGLIIVDEEHDPSYKQDRDPRYHVRDIALFRAKYHEAVLLLGSATPSLETYYRAQAGRLKLLTIRERPTKVPLPEVQIVDMRSAQGKNEIFSEALIEEMTQRLAKKEQVILFLNRRGYARVLICRECGFLFKCPHCDVSLTYHLADETLTCHYCGYERQATARCEACGSQRISRLGFGTERVETELRTIFPRARIARLDRDATRQRGAHSRIIHTFEQGEADILIGTQMVAKGLDFPSVTLVGVISADALLAFPDFRARERTFQLLTQVAGRAGRRDVPGKVIVQTCLPGDPAIVACAGHDYDQFYQQEIKMRQRLGYPPFSHLIRLLTSSRSQERAFQAAQALAVHLETIISGQGLNANVLGPAPALLTKLKNRYRYQVTIKGYHHRALRQAVREAMEKLKEETGQRSVEVSVDIDPVGIT